MFCNKETKKEKVSGGIGSSILKKLESWRPHSNLRTALILYVLLPMGIAVAVAGWWGLRAFEKQVEERMQNDLEVVARAIKKPLNHAVSQERDGSIAQALESAFEMSHVYGAYLYDAEGKKITDPVIDEEKETDETSKDDEKQKSEIDSDEVTERVAEGERHGEFGEIGGTEVYSYFVPLTDSGGRITALLQLTRRRSDFHEQISNLRYRALGGFFLAFFGLTGLVLYGHHRGFGRHLNKLSQTMRQIADGDRHQRYTDGGPREIASLGKHFNLMMDNIAQAEKEIEDQRKRQRELEECLRQAEKLAAIGELAAGVAHELGNPLSLIDAKVQRTLKQKDLPEPILNSLQAIREAGEKMERIIRQLRDFSSRNKIEVSQVHVEQLVRTTIAAVSHEARSQQTVIKTSGDKNANLLADPHRLEQALVNLLRNAIQAAPGGEVEVEWYPHQNNGSRELILAVKDNGAGIDKAHIGKIFDPFFTTKAAGEGTGLGLAVVHGIAEEHKGRVEADLRAEGGSVFRLHIPAVI